jgi:hypothetical protein
MTSLRNFRASQDGLRVLGCRLLGFCGFVLGVGKEPIPLSDDGCVRTPVTNQNINAPKLMMQQTTAFQRMIENRVKRKALMAVRTSRAASCTTA